MRYAVKMTETREQTDPPDVIVYRGIRFRRYPNAEKRTERVYYTPGQGDRRKGVQRLHQEVWKDAHGVESIPIGYHVHHLDEDTFNNDPANLELIRASDHLKEHAASEKWIAARQAWMEAGREAAKEWHSTEEGRAFHAKAGHKTWDKTESQDFTCEQCGKDFTARALRKTVHYCSNACRTAARYASGVDNEARTCQVCGSEFTVNRYSKKSHCSRKCAAVTIVARRSS